MINPGFPRCWLLFVSDCPADVSILWCLQLSTLTWCFGCENLSTEISPEKKLVWVASGFHCPLQEIPIWETRWEETRGFRVSMRKECYEITLFSTLHMKKVKAKPSLGQKWLVKLMLLYINTVSGSEPWSDQQHRDNAEVERTGRPQQHKNTLHLAFPWFLGLFHQQLCSPVTMDGHHQFSLYSYS